MKILKRSIFALTTLFTMSNFAAAGTVVPTTGHGYGTTTSSAVTPLAAVSYTHLTLPTKRIV